jgi:ectoine hydroxylase-related dioxygenase (phytanoyl-CoA dioxygenase family)
MRDFYKLTDEQTKQYARDGHICLRGVADEATIAAIRPKLEQVVVEGNTHTKPVADRDTYGKAFIQVGNVWQMDPDVQQFVFAERFAKIAADLMSVPAVRIYHDQALFKEPGGGYTPWHQDQIYWPLDTPKTITMWMPLVRVTAEVGSMTFVSGVQDDGVITREVISDESHKTLGAYIEAKGLEQINYGALEPGDATFHAGWTPHCAPGNPTDVMREVLTIIYYEDGALVGEPDSGARQNDMEKWFPGCQPGELAASAINPVLYPQGK